MALSSLGGDEVGLIFSRLANPLEQWLAVDFGSASFGLSVLTKALQQELKAEHEVVAALCQKVGMRGCGELREAQRISWFNKGLSDDDLATLGKLCSLLPALEKLSLYEPRASTSLYERSARRSGSDGMQRLAVALGADALPSVTTVAFYNMHVGDAGLGARRRPVPAPCRGSRASLDERRHPRRGARGSRTGRRLTALNYLDLGNNPFGDEASPPCWRRLGQRVRRRRRAEGWRSWGRSVSAAPRSLTPAAPPLSARSRAARCQRGSRRG